MLHANSVISKDVPTTTNVRCASLIVRVKGMSWRNSLPFTVRTFRQRLYNQKVGCLLCNMAMIYDLWSMGLIFEQAQGAWSSPLLLSGWLYRAQVPHHPIDSYRYISHSVLNPCPWHYMSASARHGKVIGSVTHIWQAVSWYPIFA